jgi:N-acetylmuramoyl-L-alanine amidase
MKYLVFRCVIAFTGFFLVYGCHKAPYAASNKSYKKQAKAYAKQLSANPVTVDSGLMLANDWVGTTNFNMRKPNFVIIRRRTVAKRRLKRSHLQEPRSALIT